MPRRFIKKLMPDHAKFRSHPHLRHFGQLLHDPNLWHLNRHSVAGAVSAGLFIAFIPLPFQMVLAAGAAIPLRVNLPICVSMVWVTNPLTIPPMFFSAYKLGAWMLNLPASAISFDFTLEWFGSTFLAIWEPLVLGCLVMGIFGAAAGNLAVRVFWRLQILKYIKRRKARRALRKK